MTNNSVIRAKKIKGVIAVTSAGKYIIKLCEGSKPMTATVIDRDGQLGIWFSISRIFTPLTDFKGLTVVEKLEG